MPEYWPAVEKWVVAALARGQSITQAPEDIYQALLGREMQLWLAIWDRPAACAITRVVHHKRVSLCEMLVIGGGAVREWLHFEAAVARWAKEQGCAAIEGAGRRGWERMATDYKPVYMVYRKMLED